MPSINFLITLSLCIILIERKVISKELQCKDKVIIVGAGLSGLAAGQKLQKAGCDVVIIEGSERIGGRIKSEIISQDVAIDLGASWIGGTGKDFDMGAKQKYYQHQKGELDIDQSDLNQYIKLLKNYLKSHLTLATDQTSLEDIFRNFTVKSSRVNLKSYKNFSQSFIYGFKNAADSDQLSAKYVLSKLLFIGKDHVVEGGFQKITDQLSKELKIILRKQVVEIDYLNDLITIKTTDGEVYQANKVIVTVPLGILKSKEILFNPPLIQSKLESIEKLGSGIMDKLFLEFDHVFWDQNSTWFNHISDKGLKWIITANLFKYTGKPILMMFNIGREAIAFSEQSDERVLASAIWVKFP
ncbi:amine oxidase [Stylonychia lemnae]|uniref:Amine oxidase n=1 Tax=Stylonychia lemnae TaxID=5949 RepID=A0A077ZTQ6_STYLE|nr:amine oxidase [Stylonychia lemnae]|eukprot:CDW72919.1 amine oxidase [Stylonychia lemnae]